MLFSLSIFKLNFMDDSGCIFILIFFDFFRQNESGNPNELSNPDELLFDDSDNLRSEEHTSELQSQR